MRSDDCKLISQRSRCGIVFTRITLSISYWGHVTNDCVSSTTIYTLSRCACALRSYYAPAAAPSYQLAPRSHAFSIREREKAWYTAYKPVYLCCRNSSVNTTVSRLWPVVYIALGVEGDWEVKGRMREEFSTHSPAKKSKRAGNFCWRQSVVQYNAEGSRLFRSIAHIPDSVKYQR